MTQNQAWDSRSSGSAGTRILGLEEKGRNINESTASRTGFADGVQQHLSRHQPEIG
jgi:hypothetical protein